MEGFDLGPRDPGSAAREAADRIAEQVREILQNAEQRAVDIRSSAEADADAIRRGAAEAAARMLDRVDQLERQLESNLNEFFEIIRGELSSLASRQDIEAAAASLAAEGRTEEFAADPLDEPRFEPRPRPATEPEPEEPEHAAGESENGEPRRKRGLLWGRRERAPGEEPAASTEGSDAEDAHVMALNMALNGTPREETESYLSQRFAGLGDLDSILDDVYGRVKGR
jgi:hypothetical protein